MYCGIYSHVLQYFLHEFRDFILHVLSMIHLFTYTVCFLKCLVTCRKNKDNLHFLGFNESQSFTYSKLDKMVG